MKTPRDIRLTWIKTCRFVSNYPSRGTSLIVFSPKLSSSMSTNQIYFLVDEVNFLPFTLKSDVIGSDEGGEGSKLPL